MNRLQKKTRGTTKRLSWALVPLAALLLVVVFAGIAKATGFSFFRRAIGDTLTVTELATDSEGTSQTITVKVSKIEQSSGETGGGDGGGSGEEDGAGDSTDNNQDDDNAESDDQGSDSGNSSGEEGGAGDSTDNNQGDDNAESGDQGSDSGNSSGEEGGTGDSQGETGSESGAESADSNPQGEVEGSEGGSGSGDTGDTGNTEAPASDESSEIQTASYAADNTSATRLHRALASRTFAFRQATDTQTLDDTSAETSCTYKVEVLIDNAVQNLNGSNFSVTDSSGNALTYTIDQSGTSATVTSSTVLSELKVNYSGLVFTVSLSNGTGTASFTPNASNVQLTLTLDTSQNIATPTTGAKVTAQLSITASDVELDSSAPVSYTWDVGKSLTGSSNTAVIELKAATGGPVDNGNSVSCTASVGSITLASNTLNGGIPVVTEIKADTTDPIGKSTTSVSFTVTGQALESSMLTISGGTLTDNSWKSDNNSYSFSVTPTTDGKASELKVSISDVSASLSIDVATPQLTVALNTEMDKYGLSITVQVSATDFSGVKEVKVCVGTGDSEPEDSAYISAAESNGTYTYTVSKLSGDPTDYTVYVLATDNAGNSTDIPVTATVSSDGVSVALSSTGTSGSDGVIYFSKSLSFTVKQGGSTDSSNLSGTYDAYDASGAKVAKGNVASGAFTITPTADSNGVTKDLSVAYVNVELSGSNGATKGTLAGPWYIDVSAPTISIDTSAYTQKSDGSYYAGQGSNPSIIVTITEESLKEATLDYTLDGMSQTQVTLTTQDGFKSGTDTSGNTIYTYTIQASGGSEISGIKVTAMDNADSTATDESCSTYTYIYDNTLPTIEISDITSSCKNSDLSGSEKIYYFNEAQEITVTVIEKYLDSISVTYKVDGTEQSISKDNFTHDSNNSSMYTYTIKLDADTTVSDIKVEASDYINTKQTKEDNKTYIIDITVPSIKASANNPAGPYETQDTATFTFTVTEKNPTNTLPTFTPKVTSSDTGDEVASGNSTYTIDVGNWTQSNNTYTSTITVTVYDGYTFDSYSWSYTDYAGNSNSASKENVGVTVDNTAPTVTVTKNTKPVKTANDTDYYNTEVTYTITVFDLNLNTSALTTEEGKPISLILESGSASLDKWDKADDHTYTATFTLNDGDKLTNITIDYQDLAGNSASYSYTGNTVVVDTTFPTVAVVGPEGSAVNSKANVYYFDADAQITVSAYDINFDTEIASSYVSYTLDGEAKTIVLSGSDNTYTATIAIPAGSMLSGLTVEAKDLATNTTTDTSISGNTYIADATGPTATVTIAADDLASVFTNSNTGGIYLKFNTADTGDSGNYSSNKNTTRTVTLTITANDKNLALAESGYQESYYVTNSDNGSWSGKTLENADTTFTYTQTFTVKADDSAYIDFEVYIQDLAGNALSASDITCTEVGGTSFKDYLTTDDTTGNIAGTVIADRTRPSSTSDYTPPVITLTENGTPVTTVSNSAGTSVSLFSSSTSYTLQVQDPSVSGKYAGLDSVTWTVESADQPSFISGSDSKTGLGGLQAADYTISVSASGQNETNDISITIVATDQAGNQTTYVHYLAIDNLDPRVTVSYDNNSAQNSKYFKADRTLTVTIEDLNFDSSKTTLTTEKSVSWSESGIKHIATVSYNTDGDYTFNMSTTDKAGNVGAVDYTNGGVNVAPQEFTIDKTVPVITVTYDNNNVKNGSYYNASRTATVTITEHNFNGSEVVYSGTATLDGSGITVPSLNGWSSSDAHTATISFSSDGDYSYTINYTDLAGNPAVVYTESGFTVDTTVPEIKITGVDDSTAYRGSLTPIIALTDVNFDTAGYTITLIRKDMTGSSTVAYDSSTASISHGRQVTLADLLHSQENDGIYTLTVSLTDLAGNNVSQTLTYSLNRNGSSYYTEDLATQNLLNVGYSNHAQVLKIIEINPNVLEEYAVTLSVGGSTRTLVEGVDYEVSKSENSGEWKRYVYTIYAEAFLDSDGNLLEGDYVVTITSTDAAGNANSNRTNISELPLLFTIDTTAPVVSITGVQDGDIIAAASQTVTVYFSDSSYITRVEIWLNGELLYVLEGEELAECDGSYSFEVAEGTDTQSLYLVVTDAAGNETTTDEISFFISSSWFQRFVRSIWFIILIIFLILLLLGFFFFLLWKRKKDEEEEPEIEAADAGSGGTPLS